MRGSLGKELKRLFAGSEPVEAARPISIVEEDTTLPALASVEALMSGGPSTSGASARAVEAEVVPEEVLQAAFEGRAAGTDLPDWAEGAGGGIRGGVEIYRVPDIHHAPAFGAVIDRTGRVFGRSVREATYLTPTLLALPSTRPAGEGAAFAPPVDVPVLAAAAVFVPWGAQHNYGHFLLDALPGLTAFAEHDLLRRFRPVAPPLKAWQRDLVDLLLDPDEPRPTEIAEPLVRIEDAIFPSCMDHFLHAPNTPLDRVRERILSRLGEPGPGRRLYLTRRGDGKRVMLNEADLEQALAERGFEIVAPDGLPVAEQVRLFRDAEVVVSATGAGLANCLFMPEGSAVFEIQPANFMGVWARGVCTLVGVRWHGYFCPSPEEETPIFVEGEHRPGVHFTWRLPLEGFCEHLDTHLARRS